MNTIYRYGRFYHDGEGWVEQMAEIAKALAELPDDMTLPKRGQRRRIEPAGGELED